MSRIIIVKLERIRNDQVIARNFDRRYEQRMPMTVELRSFSDPEQQSLQKLDCAPAV